MKHYYLFFSALFLTTNLFAQNLLKDYEFGTIVIEYLEKDKNKFSLNNEDISSLEVSNEHYSKASKTRYIYLQQKVNGIKVFNVISNLTVKNNKVNNYNNEFVSGLSQKVNAITPIIKPKEAIYSAINYFKLGSAFNLELLETGINKYKFSGGNISLNDIEVELVYFKENNGSLKLSWDLHINTRDNKHWWSIRVDAMSGEILDVNDWIVSCNFGPNHTFENINHFHKEESNFNLFKPYTLINDGSQYNVYALPTESPNHGPRTLISNPADNLASPHGWHDINNSAGPEYTITRGNNVWAFEDRAGDNTVGYSPDGSNSLNFNFSIDFNNQPISYQDAAITNLFYVNNVMHDIWYHYGFDEAAGNFQQNNYGKTSFILSGDAVQAHAQDGSGFNNANFGTPRDGQAPTMQMFLWNDPNWDGNSLAINNGSLTGNYVGVPASFGDIVPSTNLTGDLALVIDNDSGTSTDPNDACDVITNGSDLSGKIAVLRRGDCEFGVKVLAAETEGAIAVIVVNNVAGDPITMGPGAVGGSVTIPSIMVSNIDGEAIITALINGDSINATLSPPQYIDGDFDNGVIAHEYGHGISSRLTGGASNVNCLTNLEQMGEGWSDWFGLVITMKPSDVGTDGRGIGTFDLGEPTDGVGIRPSRYSTDFSINNFTYGGTNDNTILGNDLNGNPIFRNQSVHYIGFIWCTVLWDLTWAYIEKYGFDPDLYNGTGGNNKVMQLVMDGLKTQPCNPGFVDGRNALLAADNALTGGENQCLIWEVFAKRGLGINASQGTVDSIDDQTEDFTVPNESEATGAGLPSLANCSSLSNESFTNDDYRVYPNPTNNKLYIKVTRNFGRVNLSLTDLNGRQILSKEIDLIGTVSLNTNKLQSGLYILNIKGEGLNLNEKIVKN